MSQLMTLSRRVESVRKSKVNGGKHKETEGISANTPRLNTTVHVTKTVAITYAR